MWSLKTTNHINEEMLSLGTIWAPVTRKVSQENSTESSDLFHCDT